MADNIQIRHFFDAFEAITFMTSDYNRNAARTPSVFHKHHFVKIALMIFITIIAVGHNQNAFAFTDRSIIYGFNKTVFGSEFASGSQSHYIRKFRSPVKFYIHNRARKNRRRAAKRFILSLNRSIRGLKTRIVSNPDRANFHLYIVDRRDYVDTVRNTVYRGARVTVRGRCMVRSIFTRFGISRSDAVVVSDEGGKLFRRCLIEEVLQGLGPLNEDTSLSASMFNDRSRHTHFTRFDRYILNMLYDKRLKIGDSQQSVQSLLPKVLGDVKRRVR